MVRARVLARDRQECQWCGLAATDVDHIRPKRLGGSDDMDNLRALCRECHKAVTATDHSARQGGRSRR